MAPRHAHLAGTVRTFVSPSSGAALEPEDAEGMTALHYAATSDYNMPIIALLAAYGAKINAPDRFGRTPLDHAIERGVERVPADLTSRGGQTGAELRRRCTRAEVKPSRTERQPEGKIQFLA
ncbi:MAG: ankyrin repeat domain-containing protein [Hyphomicrobiaceae bacterium]